jgi:hypothetical protein
MEISQLNNMKKPNIIQIGAIIELKLKIKDLKI